MNFNSSLNSTTSLLWPSDMAESNDEMDLGAVHEVSNYRSTGPRASHKTRFFGHSVHRASTLAIDLFIYIWLMLSLNQNPSAFHNLWF